ncbi:MAG: hypothetical protein WBE31_16355, partial [Candidatus Sulfotelmatobacter sp.]
MIGHDSSRQHRMNARSRNRQTLVVSGEVEATYCGILPLSPDSVKQKTRQIIPASTIAGPEVLV